MTANGIDTAAGNAAMAEAWDGPEGDHWADNADRYEATSRAFDRALFAAVDIGTRASVLDIGCGAGAATLEAGRRASEGTVLGVDLSSRMLALGRASAAAEGLDHVRFEQADAQVHPFPAAAYDRAISVCGVMFFADPVGAFTNIRRALRPQGTLTALVWRELPRNEWVQALREALAAGRDLPSPPPGAPGPFSLADRDIATERFCAAGFVDVTLEPVDEPVYFGRDVEHAYSFVSTFGITRGLTAGLDDATREHALDRVRTSLSEHQSADGVRYAGSAWLVTARNPQG